MRFDSFTILLAGLASLTAAVSLAPASDTSPDMEHYSGYDPAPASIAAHLEGLAGCYVRLPSFFSFSRSEAASVTDPTPSCFRQARCMLDQNKYFNNDLARFTFHDFCGFYWKAVIMWEYDRVRGCALLHCMEEPCKVRADNCDVPGWIYQGTVIQHLFSTFSPFLLSPLSGLWYLGGFSELRANGGFVLFS